MLQLEEAKRGYIIDDDDPIPGGAYADDMVLHSNTRRNLQKMLDMCAEFFNYVGLEISIDGRDKSVSVHQMKKHQQKRKDYMY